MKNYILAQNDGERTFSRRSLLKLGASLAIATLAGCNKKNRDGFYGLGYNDASKSGVQPTPLGVVYFGEPISPALNAEVLDRVYSFFDDSLQSYVRAVPILKMPDVESIPSRIAYANSKRFVWTAHKIDFIGVRPDWDSNPKIGFYKKVPVLAHEFLHTIQAEKGINPPKFFEDFKTWYLDPKYGEPVIDIFNKPAKENRMKHLLFGDLYEDTEHNGIGPDDEDWRDMNYMQRYQNSIPGMEEFAYTGQNILNFSADPDYDFLTKDRLLELSDEVVRWYQGVLHSRILVLRNK